MESGTQTSVADGAGYYNLMDDAIMEEVEVENIKRSKKADNVLKLIQTNLGFLATSTTADFAKLIVQPESSSSNTPASSSNQTPTPMETVNLSKKNVYPETGTPDGPQKGGRKAKGDEVVLAPPPKTKPSVNVPADSGSAPEEKQKKSSVKTLPVKSKFEDAKKSRFRWNKNND